MGQPLDPTRTLDEPHHSRLPTDIPLRETILAAHRAARISGAAGYADPATGRFVICASTLADRGWCCGLGCRHCPYVSD